MIANFSFIVVILAFIITGCHGSEHDENENPLNNQGGQCLTGKGTRYDQSVKTLSIKSSREVSNTYGHRAFTYYFQFLDISEEQIRRVISYDIDSRNISIEFIDHTNCIIGIVIDTRENFYNKVNGIPYIKTNN